MSQFHFKRACFLFCVLWLFPFRSGYCGGGFQAPVPHKYALLAGINRYSNLLDADQLQGCVNDITLMRDFLIQQKGFDAKNIFFLPDGQANKSGITTAFQKLISLVKPGDMVVIDFSCHGSQVPDETNKESDYLDETLIPSDYVNTYDMAKETSILDSDMDGWLNAITKVTSNLTVILDACHSAGATRFLSVKTNRLRPRFIPAILSHQDSLRMTGTSLVANSRRSFPYVLLSGCQSDELSHEYIDNGTVYGAFTFFLIKELKKADGAVLWPDVMENVKNDVRTHIDDQTPQLLGDHQNSRIFGETAPSTPSFVYVTPLSSQMVELSEGRATGMEIGSLFNVYPPGTLDPGAVKPVALVEITSTEAFKSKAKILNGAVSARNSKAREAEHVYQSVLHIAFQGNWNGAVSAGLKKSLLADKSVAEGRDNTDIILLTVKDSLQLYLPGKAGRALSGYLITDPSIQDILHTQLALWKKWVAVLKIENPASQVRFSVAMSKSRDLDLSKRLSHPDYEFKNGETINLLITNTSADTLYFNLLDLKDNGGIDNFSLGMLLGQAANDPVLPGTSVNVPLAMTVRQGQASSLDVLKIYGTTRDLKLDLLNQAALSGPTGGLAKLMDRDVGKAAKVRLDDWNVLSRIALITR